MREPYSKQLPNKTCEIHFYLLCQILSTVVQDTVSRNDRIGHRWKLSICLSPCPFLCPYDWKTHWKEGRNHCGFVFADATLIGPEPKFDSPRPPVPQPVGHTREMTHRPKSEPELDSAQEKPLQHKVRIQNTTSLQTSPSRQVQELTGPAHHTTRWLQQDRKTKSLPTQLHHPRCCAQFVQYTIQCRFCKMNRAALSKAHASLVSFTEVLVVPSTTQLRHDCFVLRVRVVSRSSLDHLSLFTREMCILEKSISPNLQLKESLTSLLMSPRCLYKCVFVFDHLVFSLRADRGLSSGDLMIVTSCSRFLISGVPDTSESLGHLAKSTLLSHAVVSDDLSWSTSDLIIRLYFLVSVRHRHRCERTFSQNTKETLNSSCIFTVLRLAHSNHFFRISLQIGPQTSHCPFLFTGFQTSSKPQRCLFIVSKSQNTISAKIITEMRGADLIVYGNDCNSMRFFLLNFFESIKTVMGINSLAGQFFGNYRFCFLFLNRHHHTTATHRRQH